MTRRLGTVIVALSALATCIGCMGKSGAWAYPHSRLETSADTSDEHQERVVRVLERDRRTLGDDLDLLYQTDRPTRLSKWHGR